MPKFARKDVVVEGEVGIYHSWSRCVRRAYLCGHDPVTGRDFSHRKDWIVTRLKLFARCFAVDVCDYSIMSNHLHLVLRTRPDLVDTWSDEEVARRWWTLFPKRKNEDGTAKAPKPKELDVLTADADALAEKRRRLSSLSWFMGRLKEWVARNANKEDDCTGRFWEGRFKCQALVDDAAVLACSMYVDLNPIRAGLAETPEESEYTSAKVRIDARNRRKRTARNKKPRGKKRQADTRAADDWLCPILSEAEVRASRERADDTPEMKQTSTQPDAGTITAATPSPSFLPMRVDDYLRLLDWTGRQIRDDKPGAIPNRLVPILDRLALTDGTLLEAIGQFGKSFRRCVGAGEKVDAKAAEAGKSWFQGVTACRATFG